MTRLNTDYFDIPEFPPSMRNPGRLDERRYVIGARTLEGVRARIAYHPSRPCPYCARDMVVVAAVPVVQPVYAFGCSSCDSTEPTRRFRGPRSVA